MTLVPAEEAPGLGRDRRIARREVGRGGAKPLEFDAGTKAAEPPGRLRHLGHVDREPRVAAVQAEQNGIPGPVEPVAARCPREAVRSFRHAGVAGRQRHRHLETLHGEEAGPFSGEGRRKPLRIAPLVAGPMKRVARKGHHGSHGEVIPGPGGRGMHAAVAAPGLRPPSMSG